MNREGNMAIGGVPISQLSFGQWWMLGSAVLVLIGFLGWRLAFIAEGAKPKIPKALMVSKVSAFFLYLLLGSLAAHLAFWIYAAVWMR